MTTDLDDWQAGKSLIEANNYMLRNELGCDVTFLVGSGQEEVKAHKYVLISRSPLLQQSLSSHLDNDNLLVNVPDVTVSIFRDVITYIYTEKIEVHDTNVTALLYAARRLQIQSLLNICFQFLDSNMVIGNVCKIMEQAHAYNESNLFDKCVKFILSNGAEVLKTRAFTELCTECVDTIIGADDLKAYEDLVFESLMDWATSECRRKQLSATDETRRSVLGDLLYLIRFPTMDVTYFTQRVSFRDILSDDEAVSVFQYFHGEERELSRKFNRNERKILNTNRPKSVKVYELSNIQPMTTAQFVESRRTMRVSPTFRRHEQETPKPKESITLSIPNSPNMSRVCRFATYDGQWKQNGPPDAISFTCTSPIVLYGVEIYGTVTSRDTYKVKLYLYDDMKEEIRKNDVTITTDSFRRTYNLIYSRPIRIPPLRVFTVAVVLKGSPCNKGVEGSSVHVADGVTFEFSNSNRSSNGTDVTVGQIPALLFNRTE